MRRKLLLPSLAVLLVLPLAAPASAATWEIDRAHSSVGFTVRHLVTQVPGQFNDFDGTIVHDPENPAASSVELTVDAASIDTRNDRRDNHLRSEDFLAVGQHPTLSFKSKRVAALGDDRLAVTGDLTIRGVTKEVTVPVEIVGAMGGKMGFATEFTVDRLDYGVRWNRALDQGGAVLGDEVEIRLEIAADRVEPEESGAGG